VLACEDSRSLVAMGFPPGPERGCALRVAASAIIFSLLLLTFTCATCEALTNPADQTSSTSDASHSGGVSNQGPHDDQIQPWEIAVLATTAFLLAWLRLLTDFHRYKGLLSSLIWNGYSWVFLIFVAAFTFLVDYKTAPYIKHMIQSGIVEHVVLFLGHTTVSAASVYLVPPLLAKLPLHFGAAPAQPPGALRPEKKATEMNIVFKSIGESLEGRVNGELIGWTTQYSWPVLKFAAHMLATDQVSSGLITQEESERLKARAAGCEKCEDEFVDRQKKYELLREMINHSSFRDIRTRLRQAGKQP